MDEKHFTPYAIVERDDGLVDLLFPHEGCQARCPCHDRLTVRPRDGLEEDLRRNYDSWRARAQSATCDRQGVICAYPTVSGMRQNFIVFITVSIA